MIKAYAIILAAGRGSRMKGFTDDKPKCLLDLASKPLLQWQMEALHQAGISNILLMRGYQAHMLSKDTLPWARPFEVADNDAWQSSNMLRTLLCADAYVRKAWQRGVTHILVSYGDIVYHEDHVSALLRGEQNINITYDTLWEDLWRLRFGDPLLDAETFKQHNGILQVIGGKPQTLQDIDGQYMGLLCFTQAGWERLRTVCVDLGAALDTTDMTTFLRLLLTQRETIGAIAVHGRWCEADNQEDLRAYEEMLQGENWLHDWRCK